MERYELLLLIHPDLEAAVTKVSDKVKSLVSAVSGRVVAEDDWGRRPLAYPISKFSHGLYVFYKLELPKDAVAKLEHDLRLAEEVIRFLITIHQDIPENQRAVAEKMSREEKSEPESNNTTPPETPPEVLAGKKEEK